MDKIITVLGYKNFITEMSYAPDLLNSLVLMKLMIYIKKKPFRYSRVQ